MGIHRISTSDIVEEKGKYRIIAFRAKGNEDESFILRLVVITAWLTKLFEKNRELTKGTQYIDKKYIERIRWYQTRRDVASFALLEVEKIQMIFRYYNEQSEGEASNFSKSQI